MLDTNPLTQHIIQHRKSILLNRLNADHISLWRFVSEIPERFFSKQAAETTTDFFAYHLTHNASALKQAVSDHSWVLEIGLKHLLEINQYSFHDIDPPNKPYDQLLWFDQSLLPAFLKLCEGAFSNLIIFFAVINRLKRSKGIDGLDAYNRVCELEKDPKLKELIKPYSNVIRNSIAHGTYTYRSTDIVFTSRNSSITEDYRNIIRRFDTMLDISNGIALSIITYFLDRVQDTSDYKKIIPTAIIYEELKGIVGSPGWSLQSCLESELPDGRSQLNIFIKNDCAMEREVPLHTVRTAKHISSHVSGYDRYFLHLDSKYAELGLSFAAFDGKLLDAANQATDDLNTNIDDYIQALQEPGIVFKSKLHIPYFIWRIMAMYRIFSSLLAIHKDKTQEQNMLINHYIRKSHMFRNGFHYVVRANAIITESDLESTRAYIKSHWKAIINDAINYKTLVLDSRLTRYLPLGFVHVNLYRRDKRYRDLGVSGLIPDLIGTLTVKRLKRIQSPDIFSGIPETVKGCRIVWNNNWIEDVS